MNRNRNDHAPVLANPRFLWLALLASAALIAGCAESRTDAASPADPAGRAVDPAKSMAKLERIIRRRVDAGGSTGIVAGMVFPDGERRVVAYGDSGRRAKLSTKSVFEIGSITKVFTGTALSDMVLRGEVALDDPVRDLLPAGIAVPSFEDREITLEDLATHTSGLPSLPPDFRPEDPRNPYASFEVDDLYGFLADYDLTRSPGDRYEYSNLGVGLLGHALALQAGSTYEELIRGRVLEPLGMDETAIDLPPRLERRFVDGHDADGRRAAHWDLPTLAGAGALRSSMSDMLTFAAANLDDGDEPLAEAMATAREVRITADSQTEIGLNWHVVSSGERRIVLHNGGTGGFSTFLGLDPERGTAIVVLSNSAQSIDDIGGHMLDPSVPLVEPRKAVELDPRVLARYVGTYDLAGTRVRIQRSRGRLSAEIPGQGSFGLYPETRRRFFLKAIEAQLTFQLTAGGEVTGFELDQAGERVTAQKVG